LSGIGLFWVAHVERDTDCHTPVPRAGGAGGGASSGSTSPGSARSSLPNSLNKMMMQEANCLSHHNPAPPTPPLPSTPPHPTT
jgi:hypothetical protein